ncbi:methyl-accepting chemotaxis protein [Acuticoccus yangtzensis]|uniref:methyl-accepting chemotaxis protein n=1 Tax=Acuticoccus yangtzensis TaxID=1443441 RepID=UPI0009499BE2|nr:methyl-accepting chemotaxis protein [Acuticoccus yangtzensis]
MQYGRRPGIVNDLGFGVRLMAFAAFAASAPLALTLTGQSTVYMGIGLALVTLLLGGALTFFHGRALRALAAGLQTLADGGKVDIPADNSKDPLGAAWSALHTVGALSTTAMTMKSIIDKLPIPVMIADPNDEFKITYMNKETLSELGPLESYLPVSLNDIKGQSIDVFHQGPARIRQALSDPKRLPFRSKIVLGGKENLDLHCTAITDQSGRYSHCVLTWKVVTDRVRSANDFEVNVKSALEQIKSSFVDMRQQVSGIANATASTRSMLSSGATAVSEATANVQMVASAAEELTATIAEINDRIQFATKRTAKAEVETRSVASRAEALLSASDRIVEVMGSISGIAYKTNLLALNATIEAASAGPAGKGFAVVAHEVKMLADQTAKATDQVSEETEAVRKLIVEVASGVSEVTRVITDIRETFDQVAAAVHEQQSATRSISSSAQDAANGVSNAATTLNEVETLASSNLDATRVLDGRAEEIALANDNLSRNSDDLLKMMRSI